MNIQLAEEQRLLRDSVLKALAASHPIGRAMGRAPVAPAEVEGFWSQAAELGWLGLALPEDAGGLGGAWSDLLLIAEALGRHFVRSPFAATIGFAGRAIAACAQGREEILAGIAAGEIVAVPALHEHEDIFDVQACRASARRVGSGFVVDGRKTAVGFGDRADLLLVSAAVDGEPSLFLVDATAPGVRREAYTATDGTGAADIRFDGVGLDGDARLAGNTDIFGAALDTASMLAAAEMVGAMWTLQGLTLEYLKTRRQFGSTLGSFQALQHRLVDMYVRCQTAESALLDAAAALDGDDAEARSVAVARARLHIDRAAREVAQDSIQLHGGIGMTADYAAGAYFKRIEMLRASFGTPTWQRARHRALAPAFPA